MANTETATTSGLQTYFKQSTIWGLDPKIILGLSIAWSLRTSISLHVKTIKKQKIIFGFTESFVVGFWAMMATLRRVLAIVIFFVPSLGLHNILFHWKSEQYFFEIKKKYNLIHPNDEVHLFNISETFLWSESKRWFWTNGFGTGSGLERWNYYEDPDEPMEPSYSLYTGLTLKWTFVACIVFASFHFISIFYVKYATSIEFRQEIMYNKCVHVLQNLNLCFPFVDWDEKQTTAEELRRRYTNTETEMAYSFSVNILFSIIMLLPTWFTGTFNKLILIRQNMLSMFKAWLLFT